MTCCIIGAFENRSPETSLKRQRATGVGTSFQSSGACWQTARNRGRSAAFRRYLRGLDWLNFFLAELQTGVGPFLAIYLAGNGWNEERAGVALTIGGIAGIIAQTPVGALVDQVRRKRTLIATGIGALALGALLITFVPTFWSVMAAQVLIGGTSSIFGPAICAISLGSSVTTGSTPGRGATNRSTLLATWSPRSQWACSGTSSPKVQVDLISPLERSERRSVSFTSSCQRQEKRTFSTRTYEYDIFIFEYCLAVPANRLGFVQFSGFQLKIIQEVITISVFIVFAIFFLKEKLAWNYLVAFAFLSVAAFFAFAFKTPGAVI